MSTPTEIVSNSVPVVDNEVAGQELYAAELVEAELAARKAEWEAKLLQTGQMNLRAMRSLDYPSPANRLGLD
jgi:hypothetical protein